MKNALIICTVACFLDFEINNIKLLRKMGFKVYIATNFKGYEYMYYKMRNYYVEPYQVDFSRSPFSGHNVKAYINIKKLMKKEHWDLVHCHTPVGGVIARLAGKDLRKQGTKVIYTAHGFHFYKGAPLINWILYYQIEKWLSKYTDVLITINKEDYSLAQRKFLSPMIRYIPGVGIKLNEFNQKELGKKTVREELGISQEALVMVSVGELNDNKNHIAVINAFLKEGYHLDKKDIQYYIAGCGEKEKKLQKYINDNGLMYNVHLLGFREDISRLLTAADFFVFPSFREGLSVALMEAMASRLPVVCSEIRGNVDLIDGEKGGILFNPKSQYELRKALRTAISLSDSEREKMGLYNSEKVKIFNTDIVEEKMEELYSEIIE